MLSAPLPPPCRPAPSPALRRPQRPPIARRPASAAPVPAAGPLGPARRLVDEVREIAALGGDEAQSLLALRRALDAFVSRTPPPRPEAWRNTTGRYTRVLLNDPADPFQLVVVLWPPGARSAIHDHDESLGAVMPLMGRLSETKYAVRPGGDGDVELAVSSSRTLTPHVFSPITAEPGWQLHDVVNDTCEWAATLHVYLRSIHSFRVFAHQADGRYRPVAKRLWFDYAGGAARWDAPPPLPQSPPQATPQALSGRGACLCGQTRFTFTAPAAAQLICHCTDCQRSTGSAMAPLAFFPSGSLLRLSGETRRYGHTNSSGHLVEKEFCVACGTTLFHRSSSSPQLVAVLVGALDDPSGFSPTTEIYVDSAPHGVQVREQPWEDGARLGVAG